MQKDIRFDRLKLIAMIGIVFIHCVSNCNVLEEMEYLSAPYFIMSILYTAFLAMTNVFVIVSSYLLINKYKVKAGGIRFGKVIEICCVTSAYATAIYLILVASGAISFGLFDFFKSLFSVFVNQYWFIGAYLFLYIMSPLLFKALNALSEKEVRIVCITSLVFFSLFPTLFIFESPLEFYDSQHGKSIVWMIVLFVLTFYIDKFGMEFIRKIKKSQVVIGLSLSVFLLVLSRIVLRYISFLIHLGGDGEGRLFFDESVFIVVISFAFFVLTIKTKPKMKKGKIDAITSLLAGTTLGIYLIHNNPYLRTLMWEKFKLLIFKYSGMEVLMVIAIVIAIFIVCFLVEYIRIFVTGKLVSLKPCRGKNDRTAKN